MNTETFTHDLFLCHSSKDKAVVRPLAERLRQDGLKVEQALAQQAMVALQQKAGPEEGWH